MKTLTLEMLAGHIAHGLKFQIDTSKGYRFPEIFTDELTTVGLIDNCLSFRKAPDFYLGTKENDFTAMPVMRSLSSLTKEITHKGETFVPIQILAKIAFPAFKWNKIGFTKNYERHFYFSKGSFCMRVNTKLVIGAPRHDQLFRKLYEWHFSLDIPEELYIDVETLTENPYA